MLSSQSRNLPGLHSVAALCAAAIVFVGATVLLLTWSASADQEATDHRATVNAVEIDQIRLWINRAALDEATVRLGVASGTLDQADLEQAADTRADAWANATLRLADIDESSPTAEVDFLLQLLEVPSPVLLGDLWRVGQSAHFDNRPPTDGLSSDDTDYLDHAYTLVLYEAFVAEVDRSGNATDLLDPRDLDFIEEEVAFISDAAGYLGPDSAAPLAGSWLLNERVEQTEEFNEINALITASNIWTLEQSTKAWAAGSAEPPSVPLIDVVDQAAGDVAAVRAIIDDRLAGEPVSANTALAAAERRSSVAGLAAIATALAAFLCMAGCVLLGVRRLRHSQATARTDALTGAGNRHRLDSSVEKFQRSGLTHHLVAVIDLDRFKMVNDTYGHAMGDRILVELTRRLRFVVEELRVDEHELIRLGGDEFALTLHHHSPIDTSAFASQLEQVQHNVVTAPGGEAIPLAFSFGYVEATGSPSALDLLDAADLKAYQDKERRRENAGLNAHLNRPADVKQ